MQNRKIRARGPGPGTRAWGPSTPKGAHSMMAASIMTTFLIMSVRHWQHELAPKKIESKDCDGKLVAKGVPPSWVLYHLHKLLEIYLAVAACVHSPHELFDLILILAHCICNIFPFIRAKH